MRVRLIFTSLVATFSLSCSSNIFGELGSKTSDAALLESARRKISDADYSGAITDCQDMSSDYLTGRDPLYVCASAFAGSCGLNLINFVTDLDSYSTSPTGNVIEFLMTLNHGATTGDIDDCDTAESLLRTIGDPTERTDDENALMTLVALHKLGVVANVYADADDDDAVDGGYVTCTDVVNPYDDSVAAALWEVRFSASASGIPGASTLTTALTAACTAINVADATKNFCLATDPEAFTANQVKGALSLFSEDSATFGVGDCASDVVTCLCP